MAEGKAMGIEALLRWGTEMGICDFAPSLIPPPPPSSCLGHSLFVSHFPDAGGRGLGAARDLKKGELVLRVPKTALLTSDRVMRDEKIASCIKRHTHLSSTQVLLGYGTYTNLELLEHYGFLLHDNPNEKVFIQLDTDIFTVSTWPNDSLYIQQDGIPSFALLCCLRLWATPVNRRRVIGHLIHSGNLVSVENEVKIMNWLMKNCGKMLGKMPTTIEIDDELLFLLDKFQNDSTYLRPVDSLCSEVEIREFFRAHGLELEAVAWSELPIRVQKSLERWKLAVRWRLIYKKTLLKCVSYCKDRIYELSSQHGLLREVDQT